MMRGPERLRRGSVSDVSPRPSGGRRKSRRTGNGRPPAARVRLRKQLGLEQLEDRRVMSVFYDIQAVSAAMTSGGHSITAIDTDVSVNERGQVAFVAELDDGGEALVVGDGINPPLNLSSLLAPIDDQYSAPQITGDGKVVVHSDTLAVGAAEEFDSNDPVSFTQLITAEGFPANPGSLTAVTAGLRAEDGAVAFVGQSDALAVPALYFANGGFLQPDQAALLHDSLTRPMVATGRTAVFRQQNGATFEIVVVRQSGASYVSQVVASTNAADPAKLFQDLGPAPGISDDGSIVVFSGDRGHGPGVFAVVNEGGGFGSIIRVAGESTIDFNPYSPANPLLPNNELGYDGAGNAIYLSTIDLYRRVGVERMGLGGGGFDGESFVVTFVGKPSEASVANPAIPGGATPLLFSDQLGIWSVRVDSRRELQAPQARVFHPTSPLPVVQLHDKLDGEEVIDLELYDPVAVATFDPNGGIRDVRAADHYVAFWAGVLPLAGPAVSKVYRAAYLDTDSDGLLDHWERPGGGIDIDQDGAIDLDLSAMGASPLHKDVFLEIDWLADQPTRRFEPAPSVTSELVAMFAQSPLANPDGTTGVRLHIDAGAGVDATGAPYSQQLGSATPRGGDQIGMAGAPTDLVQVLHFGQVATVPGVNTRPFEEVKASYFGNHDNWARELAFHYTVLADFQGYYPANTAPLQGSIDSLSGTTLVTNGYPFGGYTSDDLKGVLMLITSGPAAGQTNTISGLTGTDTLTFYQPWAVAPNEDDEFVLVTGSSGLGETAFFPAPDNHGLPGSDFLMTLGGFRAVPVTRAGVGTYTIRGRAVDQWRTLAHEMGHTLSLRHCGTDTDAETCKALPFSYLSLMSYAHQLKGPLTGDVASAAPFTLVAAGTPFFGKSYTNYVVKITAGTGFGQERKVLINDASTLTLTTNWLTQPDSTSKFSLSMGADSYSGPADPEFYDWGNLRPDFHTAFAHLGNTQGRGLGGGSPEPPDEMTLVDYLDVYGSEPDVTPPTSELYDAPGGSPQADGEEISKGRDLTVYIAAADDQGVGAVWARFDADGDGSLESDEIVLALYEADSGMYVATIENITGEVGTRTLDALVFDTSGNFALDSVDVEVTHDYAFLAELFEQIGQALQEAIPEIPVTVSIPFLDNRLADVIDFAGTFATLADKFYGDVQVTGGPVASPVVAADQTLFVTIDGGAPLAVSLPAANTVGNANIAALVADLNAALAADGLDGELLFGWTNDGVNNHLTLDAIADFARSLTLTTLQLRADTAVPVAYGQLSSDAEITLTVTRLDDGQSLTSETQNYTLTIAAAPDPDDEDLPHTQDNALPEDLVDDLNAALARAGVDGVYARLDASGRIALAAIDVSIDQLAVADSLAGSLAALGFTATTNASAALTPLGFLREQAIAELRYDTLEDFAVVLTDVLNDYTDSALPPGFDVDLAYDEPSDTLTFNFALNKSYEKSVALNLVDEGIDLGVFGTLDVAALGDATFSVDAGLNFRLGLYLGDLGSGFSLDGSTLLSELNGGAGVDVLVGMTADNAAPGNGQLGSNVSFSIAIEREDGSEDTVHGLTLYQAASISNPARPASSDNFNVASLVSDLNTLFDQAGLGEIIEAATYTFEDSLGNVTDERVQLRAVQTAASGLSPIRGLRISGAEALGFGTNQEGNFADLEIRVVGDSDDTYLVDLDGTRDVQDVIAAIQAQTGGAVAAAINADCTGLQLSADGLLTVQGAFTTTRFTDNGDDSDNEGFRSLAAAGLGVLASNAYGSVPGQALHGASLTDRVFIEENASGDPNFTFTAGVEANLDASAALGCLGLSLATTTPLSFVVTASAHLADPNADDSRIYLREVFDDPAAVVDMSSATLGASAAGVIELTMGSTELDPPASPDPDLLEQVSGQTDPLVTLSVSGDTASGFSFTADTNFQDIVAQFQNVCLDDILNLLSNLADELQSSSLPIVNVKIPLLDKSLGDLIDFGDGLVDAASRFLASVDVADVEAALDDLDTAIANLSLPLEDRDRLFRIGELLRGLTSQPEQAPGESAAAFQVRLDEFTERLPGKLLSGLIQLGKIINADVPDGTIGQSALETAFSQLADLLPSWNTLADRLEQAIEGALVDVGFAPGDIDVAIGFVDYDGNAGTDDNALVVGLTISHTVSDTFAPQLPVTSEFGPISFEVDPSLAVVAGGTLALGFGITLDSSATPFVIVDPPANPDLVKTSLNLNAGFDGSVSGNISLGSLDLVEAQASLILANAVHETKTVSGGSVTLSAAPLSGDERFVIVTAGGSLVPTQDFTISGSTLTFASLSNGTPVEIEYQTAATPGANPDPLGDPLDRAQLDIDFVPSSPIVGNAIGAVSFGSWLSNTNVAATGMVTGALDVSFLGNTVEDGVTLAVGLNHLTEPRLEVDSEALAGMFTNLDFDLMTIIVGIEKLLELLEDGLTNEVVTQIPVVGDGFDAAGTFVGKLEGFVEDFRIALQGFGGDASTVQGLVQSYIYSKLGPAGLNILGNLNAPAAIDVNDVEVELDSDHFQIFFRLAGHDEVSLDFDIGLDGLPISAEGQGGLEFGWDYAVDFGIGVDREQGIYLVADAANPEITFNIDAGLAVQSSGGEYVPTGLTLDLFGLQLSATDNVNQATGVPGTHVGGSLELDLVPTSGNRLPLGDLASASFVDLFGVDLNATAAVDMILEAGLGSNLPSIQTELVLGCTAGASFSGGELDVNASCSSIELKNTGINLGDFLSKHLGSLINRIKEYLEPIEPVIRLLKAEVPGVSQLSEAAGNGPVTMLDLALMDYPDVAKVARKFVDALDTILQIADSLETMDNGSVVFKLMDDLNLPAGNVDDPDWAGGVDVDASISGSGGQTHEAEESTGTIKSLLQAVEELGINLHFLEIGNIVRMLLGQPFDVISYELPRFELPFDYAMKFPVWTPPPISVEVGLHAEVFADLSVGYDSHGLDTGNFFDGFYFGDRENVFTGDDIDEFGLGVGVSLAALLDLVVASAGVEGQIRADIFANWRDQDDDGKMHLDELVQIVETDGVGCIFDLRGELRALVSIVWEVFGADGSYTFIDALLFSFHNECPTFQLGHVAEAGEALPDGSTTAAGTLVLHAGAFAGQRGPGSSSDVAEAFTVTEIATGVYDIEGLGLQSRYAGVSSIFFDGGAGDDALYLVDVTVPVTAYGGGGQDILQGGSADDDLDGGAGNDELYGFAGSDTLVGGGGDDLLDGDAGDDTMSGDAGNDTLDGGADNDALDGGSGSDVIHGRAGQDTIDGGSGDDWIYGGADNDTLDGGPNADVILGEGGVDTIRGGSGGDLISGGSGGDFVDGESGNDLIVGGRLDANADLVTLISTALGIDVNSLDKDPDAAADSADELWGGLGNDLLIGDQGADKQYGGWGNDIILAHLILDRSTTFAEYIEGGPDDDFVCGGSGADEIYGGTHSAVALAAMLAEEGGATYGGAQALACDQVPTIEPVETGELEGRVFFDQDADGTLDSGEAGLAGWTVNLYDVEGDLVDSTLTAADGSYAFSGVDYGSYKVAEVIQPGYVQTSPATLSHSISVSAGGSVLALDFGNDFLGAVIKGQKFHDLNGNRIKDPGEDGLNGWQIQLLDENGELVASTMTADYDLNNDDFIDVATERGLYFFNDLVPGTYWVSEVARSGWIQSTPPLSSANTFQFIEDDGFSQTRSDAKVSGLNGTITDVNVSLNVSHETLDQLKIFLLSPSGTRIDLADGVGGDRADFNGTIFDDEAFWRIDAVLPYDGYAGDYAPQDSLSDLDGENPNGVWTLVIQDKTEGVVGRLNSWSVTIATSGGDNLTFNGGSINPFEPDRLTNYIVTVATGDTATRSFGNFQPGRVRGIKFEDLDGDGKRKPGEAGLPDVTIYADLNNNGQLDRLEPRVVTERDNPATLLVNEAGRYELASLPPGSYVIREVVPPRSVQTFPPTPPGTPYPAGYTVQISSGDTIGGRDFGNEPRGDVRGTKWLDQNGNGVRDAGEPGLAGVTVYVDMNQNGQWDADEPYDVTQPDNPQTKNVDESGQYTLANLPLGTHTVREVVPKGYVQTSPTGQHVVTLEPYAVVVGIDFGNRRRGGEVGGEKYEDRNGNHRRDPDEPGLAGVVIYADLNNNGRLDDNEPSTVTLDDDPKTRQVNEAGQYWLRDLPAGTLVIREIVPAGYEQTTGGRQVLYANDFEQPAAAGNPVGDEWSTDQVSTSPNGQRTFLGLFENETVTLTLGDLPAHDSLLVSFDLIVAGSWNGNHPRQGPDRWQLSLRNGQTLLDTTFSNASNSQPAWQNPVDPLDVDGSGYIVALDVLLIINRINAQNQGPLPVPTAQTPGRYTFYDVTGDNRIEPVDVLTVINKINGSAGSIPGTGVPLGPGRGEFYSQAFPEAFGVGLYPPQTGAAETDTLGYDAFRLSATDGRYRPNDAVYHLTFTVPHTGNSAILDFRALGLTNSDLDFEKWSLDNVVVAIPTAGYSLEMVEGESIRGVDFGNRPTRKWDFGDSPDQPYPTLLAQDGARHVIMPSMYLGTQIDADPDGQPTGDALGDDREEADDDDGVLVLTQFAAGKDVRLEVLASTRGYLNAWADFNGDGDWTDAGEHFIADRLLSAGSNLLSAAVPDVQLPPEFLHARFRFSTQQGLSFQGPAPNGEVEDYRFSMKQTPGAGEGEPGAPLGLVVSGTVWLDSDGDGSRDAGEIGMPGVTVYADLNRNGQFDGNEPNGVSRQDDSQTPEDESGFFSLRFTADGNTLLRQVVPKGYQQTYPTGPGGFHTVAVIPGAGLGPFDFGNRPDQGEERREVDGVKWHDLNGDGKRQRDEPGLAGVTIYVDLNQNGKLDEQEPYAVTQADNPNTPEDELGTYRLTGVPAGTIVVREIVPAGYVQTYPTVGFHVVVIEDVPLVVGVDFGNRRDEPGRNIVTGTKWHDQTGEIGVRDQGDPGLPGVTVYVDLNGNGHYDANEPSAVTQSDNPQTPEDETGQYRIMYVPDGKYQVLEVAPAGWKQSYPKTPHVIQVASGTVVKEIDFGNFEYKPLQDGDDLIYAGDGADLVYGDNLVADPFVVSVGTRRDTLYGEAGKDKLYGQERDDQLSGGADQDQLDGGEDIDRVLQTSDLSQILADDVAPFSATLTDGPSVDSLVNIEHATLTGQGGNNGLNASGFSYGSVILQGGAGNDTLIGTAFDDTLEGGDGDDTLQAGAGNDRLNGGPGSDSLDGGDGADRYVFESTAIVEVDTITDTAAVDVDWLDFTALPASDPLTVDLLGTPGGSTNNRTLVFTDPQDLENIAGGAGDDVIMGNLADNGLLGGAGDDVLRGMGGNDVLVGSAGDDLLDGGLDNDTYLITDAWGLADQIVEAGGDDALNLSRITDNLIVTLSAGSGLTVTDGTNTLTHAGNEIEHLLGGKGGDVYTFQDGAQLASGGGDIADAAGNDLLNYSAYTTPVQVDLLLGTATGTAGIAGIEHVFGGANNDVLKGDSQNNILWGHDGDDQLVGRSGNDYLVGAAGNDVLLGNAGDDVYWFGPAVGVELDLVDESPGQGADTLDFSTLDESITADLTSDTLVTAAHRTVAVSVSGHWANFENLTATEFDDTLTPNGKNNVLVGGDGHDTYRVLETVSGTATFVEQPRPSGSDPALGGVDLVDFSTFAGGVTFDMSAGDNTLSTGLTIKLRDANNAAAPLNFEDLVGGAGSDTLTGNDGDNVLDGGLGNDTLYALRGADTLVGGEGTNHLYGGVGDDTYVFVNPAAAVSTTLHEDAGIVGGGQLSPGGVDTIDLSALTTAVTFDLSATTNTIGSLSVHLQDGAGAAAAVQFEILLGSATHANHLTGNDADNLIVGGISGDQLTGGGGSDILVGGSGGDTLWGDDGSGTAGRDQLFGGPGGDTLHGGDEDDLLASGGFDSTSPLDRVALDAIRLAWRSQTPYADRVAALTAGVGPANQYKLNASTYQSDANVDTLFGELDSDWFLVDDPAEVSDVAVGESVTDLG